MSINIDNYYSDARTQAPAKIPTVELEVIVEGEAGNGDWYETRELPHKWGVCPVCDGKGSHVNPSIDANGLTGEDFADDPDFAEDYFSGLYDQPCNHCRGRTTVPVVDEGACTAEELEAWRDERDAEAAYQAECLAELRMGA